MERYQEYKDSGEQWLGKIPSHWEMKRLGSYFNERKSKVSDKDYAPLSVTKNGILPQLENVAKSNDSDNRKQVCAGDFVINSRSDRKGSSGVSLLEGSVSLINIVLQPRKSIYSPFCNYLLKSNAFIEEYYRNGRGIVADLWTTRYDEMKSIKLAMPSLSEQTAMVAYLDRITAQIDKAIAQQQRMIDLLNERKQIIIQHAVTKGLDPNAEMVDSGVEWCDKMPADWNIRRLRYLCKIKTGDKDTIMREDEGKYPFFVRSPKVERINSYTFDTEAILMSGDGAGAGRIFHYYKGKFGCHQRVYCFHNFSKDIYPQFLYYQLSEKFKEVFLGQAAKSTVDSVRLLMLKDFQIIFPTLAEQRNIVEHIKKTIKPIEKLIVLSEQKINSLRERKQIIINEVVTGKVKVS